MVSINPATQNIIKKIKVSTKKDIDNAVKRARKALRCWIDTPIKEKIRIVKRLANFIRKDKKNLSRLITQEMGKPLCESESTIPYVAEFVDYYADNVEGVLNPEKKGSCIIRREPIGVVAVITPWNFPLYVTLDILIPALLTGNTIVFKPSETTTLVGLKTIELLRKAGIPKDVINLVIGADEEGKYLVKSDVNMVAFVGSAAAGKNIMRSSADKLHQLCLELGGKDAAIVCKDADIEVASRGIVTDTFRNCGQVCCSVERVYVVKEIADEFIKKVIENVKKIRVGNGMDKGVTMVLLPINSNLTILTVT